MSIQNIIAKAQNDAVKAAKHIEDATVVEPQQQAATGIDLSTLTPEQLAQLQAQLAGNQAQPTTVQQAAAQANHPVMQAAAQQTYMPMAAQQQQVPAELAMYANMGGTDLDAMLNAGIAVDEWLKPSYGTMAVGDTPVKPFEAVISMNDGEGFTPAIMVRYQVNGTAQYLKTYDNGITTRDGEPWMQAIQQAKMVADSMDMPSKTFDIVLTATEDVIGLDDSIVAKAGTVLGHTTPHTGLANAVQLIETCLKSGLAQKAVVNGKQVLQGQSVRVRVINESKTNKKGHKWGVLKFELLGAAE